MNIIVDAMGGDNGPKVAVKGAVDASKNIDKDAIITICGDEKILNEELEKYNYSMKKWYKGKQKMLTVISVPGNTTLIFKEIIEEALNNSIKHSGGTEISLFTRMDEDRTKISTFITDNGKGIPEDILNKLNSKNYKSFKKNGNVHFGIQNMKQRAQLLNANLLFSSIEGDGAEVLLEIPTGGFHD